MGGVHKMANLKESKGGGGGGGSTEMYGDILKIHFCISDGVCLQQQGQDLIMLYKSCEDWGKGHVFDFRA